MAKVNSTACASNNNKIIHCKVFCTTNQLLSHPSKIYDYFTSTEVEYAKKPVAVYFKLFET